MTSLLIPLLVSFSSFANSKEPGDYAPVIVAEDSPPAYEWIAHLSSGPVDESFPADPSPNGARGMFYRLAFIGNDDVFSRPTMRIDELIYGDAGCCWTIKRSWKVDFNELEKSGVQMPSPEMSSVDSVTWLGARTAKIVYGESKCTISGIGETSISVRCTPKAAHPLKSTPTQ